MQDPKTFKLSYFENSGSLMLLKSKSNKSTSSLKLVRTGEIAPVALHIQGFEYNSQYYMSYPPTPLDEALWPPAKLGLSKNSMAWLHGYCQK